MKTKLQIIFIPLFYSGLFFLTNYLNGRINYLDLALFTVGVVSGIALMNLDETVFYKYYMESRSAEKKLITRSLLFIISLLPMGLFIITSTGSESGIGLFLGIITVLLLELITHRNNIDLFHSRFMSQLKRRLSIQEIKYFVAGFTFLTFIFVLLAFFFGR